ncbi:hypothetical protein BKA63DRAFT_564732 [Paraphoma chrysanthemicola]|nr:hypothetical protein BKA63DRAFT_564732 [Paraphoma chrysanthemicola]
MEKKKRLQGHTEIYVDLSSGTPVDYGVVIFHDEERVRNYFTRFGIGSKQNISSLHSVTFDFRTGKTVSGNLFTAEQVAAALQKYSEIISQGPDLDRDLFLPKPSFVAYSSHAPFYLPASAADIAGGLYESLDALQGERNTYWTGASWQAHDSSSLWRFNEELVLLQLTNGLWVQLQP